MNRLASPYFGVFSLYFYFFLVFFAAFLAVCHTYIAETCKYLYWFSRVKECIFSVRFIYFLFRQLFLRVRERWSKESNQSLAACLPSMWFERCCRRCLFDFIVVFRFLFPFFAYSLSGSPNFASNGTMFCRILSATALRYHQQSLLSHKIHSNPSMHVCRSFQYMHKHQNQNQLCGISLLWLTNTKFVSYNNK